MAQGFGTQSKQLGYVLLLYPKARGYAARHSLSISTRKPLEEDEPFIGVTNMLEDAQRWKRQQDARNAIKLYMTFVRELIEDEDKAEVRIQRLVRSAAGSLSAEDVVKLTFSNSDSF